ncbi:MAG TPA: hypothetical protein VI819_02040 [Patescibacteria group bacterium]|nr:hypothetical protein [Patescibacteria group bacterium]
MIIEQHLNNGVEVRLEDLSLIDLTDQYLTGTITYETYRALESEYKRILSMPVNVNDGKVNPSRRKLCVPKK